ncbi:hypothetical protein [Bacillus cereus group sp. BfR-BA-01349]|uniref:hypothetical protein n=1 Tax=Bacillus cereus group sp. BfR-BA-01349 TaxID=2920312 RepID=UPI001F57E694
MINNLQDVIAKVQDFTNKIGKQRGAKGCPSFNLVPVGYESYAVSATSDVTVYKENQGTNLEELEIASSVFSNEENEKKNVVLNLYGTVRSTGEWSIDNGASELGKRLLRIEPSNDPTNDGDQSPIDLYLGDVVSRVNSECLGIERPFTIKPRCKITATLMVKQKEIKRKFEVKRELRGYVGISFKQDVDGKEQDTMMLYHIAAILKPYEDEDIKILEDLSGVKHVYLIDKGIFIGTESTEVYIKITEENLDTGFKEEYQLFGEFEGDNVSCEH